MQSCIVLAGGLGMRLRSAVADRPKCLAPVGSRSFLELQIAMLLACGIDDIVLSLGYMADQVVAAVEHMAERRRVRHVVEPAPLGTGGAIDFAMDSLGLDEALVANGDTHLDGAITGMLEPLRRDDGELLRMAVVAVPDRSRFGGVHVNARGQVERFLEKGGHGPGQINAGLYRLCRAALPTRRSGGFSLENEVLPDLVRRGEVSALAVDGSFIDIGVPEDYLRFCARHGR